MHESILKQKQKQKTKRENKNSSHPQEGPNQST